MKDRSPHSLRQALVLHSPRHQGARSNWRAIAIHLLVLALWVALLREAFMQGGMMSGRAATAWSLGIAYVTYRSEEHTSELQSH
mgnify:CR=1 FL=1